ncbi:MAG: NAD(P)/FAD-dependent oxidoreductase [Hyphomicrobiales bacterium]|uniref:FAD-dependent oxidoreductase n=1 Tax=Rhabdaerophilum calidifontis TaxID=2604328 RepID=UPI00197D5782|nr:FAD/NAD(P)-binding oxidoreductase [Rhabdaerophilum calidifontis]MCA1951733.1 NAD(P)/FAD-dependent oxidoreductase [Hyphomicrobiales bacterium]
MGLYLNPEPSRRNILGLLAAAGAGITARPAHAAPKVASRARIVIAGAGAAGLAAASRLAARLDGASITLIDARKAHFYQPGFTLIAAGLKPKAYAISATRDYLPAGVMLIEDSVAVFEPQANRVRTVAGTVIDYDFLIVATGLQLDYGAIAGMETGLIGREGIGSVYAGPDAAEATWREMARFTEKGGIGLFHRPETEMKCAGAPLKYTFLTDDRLRRAGTRSKSKLIYAAQNRALFSVPIVSEKVRMLFEERDVAMVYDHVMTAIDPGRRIATFRTPNGPAEIGYDFINVIPPMRAPEAVRRSGLGWQSGPFAADGWLEVDPATLRHRRFPNVFGIGDVAGVPKGKTAASVKWQVPVAVDHLIGTIEGRISTETYAGYTSCPLITRIGRAMLVEFDYNNNLVPSFPGVIAPLEELWISWVMKEIALKPTYIAMLRGQA